MYNKSDVVLYRAKEIRYPVKEYCFRPSEVYPEYVFSGDIAPVPNEVYDAVRNALYLLGLDSANYGNSDWNPLGELIRPGNCVLIKPNMVMDHNPTGEGTECLYTQPSVVAAVIDYVVLALKGQGRIVIGDAPMQECKFEKLISESGYDALIEYYKKRDVDITLVDFRELKTEKVLGTRHQIISKSDKGTIIDLKEQSEFAGMSEEQLKRVRITNYDPSRLNSHHMPGKHEYYISNYVLEADVVINMPKPKTHRKAGVTIGLKNLVGINVRKEFLPHHTQGSAVENGDEYRKKSILRHWAAIAYDKKNACEGNQKYFRSSIYRYIAELFNVLTHAIYKDEMEGNWHGNCTISKTIVDLNKILLYADKDGVMRDAVQRKVLNIADLIISGEKEGPVTPSPKMVGYIAAGVNSVNFDKVIGAMMGADIQRIPVLQNAENTDSKYKIAALEAPVIISNNSSIHAKRIEELQYEEKWNFVSTSGWREIFEQE